MAKNEHDDFERELRCARQVETKYENWPCESRNEVLTEVKADEH